MEQPDTRYVERPDGVSIAYQVVGDGPTDLLFSTGFVSHLDFLWTDPGFTAFVRELTTFARVILYDKPGTGASDPVTHVPTLEERADDMRIVLDAAGADRAVVFGYSESAMAAVLLAAAQPERVRSLILCGAIAAFPPRGSTDEQADAFRRRALELAEHWGEGLLGEIVAPSTYTPVQKRFWARFERAAASRSMLQGIVQRVLEIDVREALPTVHTPTLVLHKTDDYIPIEAGREVAELLPNARFVELPGTDHAFWTGEYDDVLAETREFVAGTRDARAPARRLISVVFTDLAGSTRKAAAVGDAAWRDVIARHNALVEQHVTRSGGRVVKFLGDGAMAAFTGPAAAVLCAGDLVAAAPGQLGLEMRAGVHAGECETVGDDLAGIAVHVGARVCALAAPGEVLVSDAVCDLVRGSGLAFESRGAHELKGVSGSWSLHALEGTGPGPRESVDPQRVHRRGDRVTLLMARRAPGVLRALGRAARRQAA